MHDASDMELLRDYDRQGSEAAFAALVDRHIGLVYSAAPAPNKPLPGAFRLIVEKLCRIFRGKVV